MFNSRAGEIPSLSMIPTSIGEFLWRRLVSSCRITEETTTSRARISSSVGEIYFHGFLSFIHFILVTGLGTDYREGIYRFNVQDGVTAPDLSFLEFTNPNDVHAVEWQPSEVWQDSWRITTSEERLVEKSLLVTACH